MDCRSRRQSVAIAVVVLFLSLVQRLKAKEGPGRVVVPFQYGWRFHYGDDPSSPPLAGPSNCTYAFEENLQDRQLCNGMEHNPNRFSEMDCRMACCYDPNCYAWQAFPLALGRECYHAYGPNVSCPDYDPANLSGLGGGMRAKSPEIPFRTDYSFAEDGSTTRGPDVDWSVVDAPHDFISEFANFSNDITNFKQGYLPRNASWYRKHFVLPDEWSRDGGATYVYFEGVFHHATIFLNGNFLMEHECGYTSFSVRLDNATGVRHGGNNVLAVRTDASFGSGHWYEGGGIYRPVHLIHVPAVHVVFDGLFVPPEGDGSIVRPSIEIERTGPEDESTMCVVEFTIIDPDSNETLARNVSSPFVVGTPSSIIVDNVELRPTSSKICLWSIQHPKLYRVRASVISSATTIGSCGNDVVDTLVGFRTTSWSSDGFELNDEAVQLRGFSHHNSMGGLGTAIPERVWLFQVQASRSLGANMWRCSHNPYAPSLYELLDRGGVMSWDENRDYGGKYRYDSHSGLGAYTIAMRDMVKRDRNHPSVIIYSFCNEFECKQNDPIFTAEAFRAAALSIDPTRPLTANVNGAGFGDLDALDVQGFSHSNNKSFESFHASRPFEATVLSECCSCVSQRPNRSLPTCISDQNSPGLDNTFVAGSLGVWTLFDYFGEPAGTGTSGWPFVSSDFGNLDIAGWPKPHSYWYLANWLQRQNDSGRPLLPRRPLIRVLSLPSDIEESGVIHTISTTPFAELYADGKSLGCVRSTTDVRGFFADSNETWTVPLGTPLRNLTLVGRDDCSGPSRGIHTVVAAGADSSSYRLELTLDVPSLASGTGTSLYLDGRDVAMVRASIIDIRFPSHPLVSSARNRVHFRVISGPGYAAGVSNGDPADHTQMKSSSVNAFMGLARGIFSVAVDCTSANRDIVRSIDLDANLSRIEVVDSDARCASMPPIVVEARADGIVGDPVNLTIPVSSDSRHSPFFIAGDLERNNGLAYFESFGG